MRSLLVAISLSAAAPALAASVEEDVQYYLNVLKNSDARFQGLELEKLSAMGLSDPRLFDLVEQRLLANYEAARGVKAEQQRVAWYFRALGFSGQEKYAPTLSRFTEDRTYRNYAMAALRDQPNYAKWNPVISARASFEPRLSDNANRAMNMLRSDDILLQRIAAKRVFLTYEMEPAVADLLAERLRASYPTIPEGDAERVETAGWLINALSRAGIDKHAGLLREVSAKAQSSKLRDRARSVLERGQVVR